MKLLEKSLSSMRVENTPESLPCYSFPHTHKNLIIINTQVNFQIFLSFPYHVSSELIRLRLFSPNNYHESGSHEFSNS